MRLFGFEFRVGTKNSSRKNFGEIFTLNSYLIRWSPLGVRNLRNLLPGWTIGSMQLEKGNGSYCTIRFPDLKKHSTCVRCRSRETAAERWTSSTVIAQQRKLEEETSLRSRSMFSSCLSCYPTGFSTLASTNSLCNLLIHNTVLL